MMLGKTSFILSFAGLILLAMPGEQAPASQPQSAEISAVIALPAETPENRGRPVVAPQDQRPDAVKNLRITKEITVTRWLQPGEYVWSAEDAAAARGPATVVVNLRSRTLSVYRGGVELGRSSMLYGFGEHPTPARHLPGEGAEGRSLLTHLQCADAPHAAPDRRRCRSARQPVDGQ
jgi:hypothetical protein